MVGGGDWSAVLSHGPHRRVEGQSAIHEQEPDEDDEIQLRDAGERTEINETQSEFKLSPFKPVIEPIFQWEDSDGISFAHSLACCYAEIVHWKKSLFSVPFGNVGNHLFVS